MEYRGKIFRFWQRGGWKAIRDAVITKLRRGLGLPGLNANELNLLISSSPVTSWIEHATLEQTPLISVILPTHNRSGLLRRAIESVCRQNYNHWEVVLVDDGSGDNTPAAVEQFRGQLGEGRLQAFRIPPSGVSAARNYALGRARGEFIAYLDDDNVMHPLWLKAVVWAFSQHPEADVVYGARIIDDVRHVKGRQSGDLPSYFLRPFDRKQLLKDNLADMGQIAHRSGLPQARFDENLRTMVDWDLLVRLTRDKAPLVIPVIACFYFTQAPDRLSNCSASDADASWVRVNARRLFR